VTNEKPKTARRWFFPVAFAVVVLMATVASTFASSLPDGLAFVAGQLGFLDAAAPHASDASPLAGYGVAGLAEPSLARGLAGLVGILVVLGIALVLGLAVRRRYRRAAEAGDGE
jgi:cobalt/nickel transport system permease protein/cobalt/nickel transport protein